MRQDYRGKMAKSLSTFLDSFCFFPLFIFEVIEKEPAQTHELIISPAFLLNTVNLNQATPNSYYP